MKAYLRLRQAGFSREAIAELLAVSSVVRPHLPKLPKVIEEQYRASSGSGPKEIWGLAIGVNKYKDGAHLPKLDCAESDALDFAISLLQVGVPPDQVAVLIGKEVRPEKIGKLVQEIVKALGNVYLFFSGHGLANNKEFYLGCANTIAKDVQNTAYPISELKKILSGMRSRRAVVLLDACHSGAGKA